MRDYMDRRALFLITKRNGKGRLNSCKYYFIGGHHIYVVMINSVCVVSVSGPII